MDAWGIIATFGAEKPVIGAAMGAAIGIAIGAAMGAAIGIAIGAAIGIAMGANPIMFIGCGWGTGI
jgi:hypothetical protein